MLQSQSRPPEEMQGTSKGEGGEYNSKDLPKASVSLCQVQADGHIHYSLQATQTHVSVWYPTQWQKKAQCPGWVQLNRKGSR